MPASDKRVYLYVSPALRDWLQDRAIEEGVSMNRLIVDALEALREREARADGEGDGTI